MQYNLVIDTLRELDAFQKLKAGNSICLDDFRCYLNEKANEKLEGSEISAEKIDEHSEIENEIAEHVIMLGRYSKHVLKKSLENHPDLFNEDFTYLLRLRDYSSLTKMQLIEKNAHEKQSGIEIIKRLVRNGLLKESPDKKDKRSTRISLTAKGKKVFQDCVKDLDEASKILCGKLQKEEKENFLLSLEKLNNYHQSVYQNMKNQDGDKLLK